MQRRWLVRRSLPKCGKPDRMPEVVKIYRYRTDQFGCDLRIGEPQHRLLDLLADPGLASSRFAQR